MMSRPTIYDVTPLQLEIIETIHDSILTARERNLNFIRQTRSEPSFLCGVCVPIRAERHGYVTRINLASIGAAVKEVRGEVEIIMQVSIGSFVGYHDVIAHVKAESSDQAEKIGHLLLSAIMLERQRNIAVDPSYGIQQLEMIAWTSISTSKSDPSPGLLVIRSLRDVLARWSERGVSDGDEKPISIVYHDNVFEQLMSTLETLAICSSESMQHQNYIEVLNTFTNMFARLRATEQNRAEDIILRILSALGDFVLTAELDSALQNLSYSLEESKRYESAEAVRRAQEEFGHSVGNLNSRWTRAHQQLPTN